MQLSEEGESVPSNTTGTGSIDDGNDSSDDTDVSAPHPEDELVAASVGGKGGGDSEQEQQ